MAEYSIDIAANMPAGETTIAQLEALAVQLTGAAAQSTKFYQQIQQVSGALDAAKAATQASAAALAEGNAQYRELEKAANVAAKAVEKAALKGALDPAMSRDAHLASEALAAYGGTLKDLESAAAGAASNEAKLASQLQAVKLASSAADKALADQAKAAEVAGKAAAAAAAKEASAVEEAKREADQLAKANEALGVKSGKASRELVGLGKIDKLKEAFSSSGGAATVMLGATVAVTAAVVALVVAVIASTVALASWAVGLADGKRSAALAQEAVQAMNPAIAAAAPLFGAITRETGQTAAELNGLVKSLTAAKVSAEDMPDALRAAALAEAALGKGGSQEFVDNIKAGKVAVSQLAADVQGKLGGIVAKQMRGLDAQTKTFKANVASLFGGLNIEPVLAGLERLVGLFDENTVAGQTIKFLFESVFQPLIDQAENASIVIEAFALGFLIGLTKVYIAVKPAIKAVKEFFGFDDSGLADTLDIAKKAGELIVPVFLVFVGVIAAVAVAVGAAIAQFVLVTSVIVGMVAAVIYAGVSIVQGVIGAWQAVTAYLSEIDLVETGKNILQGLADGITGAAGFVKDAVANAVNGAIKSAKDLLGIASPSKVFAEIGGYTGEGFTQGVDDSAPDAQAAMTDMVDPAPAAAKAEGAPAGGGSSGKAGGANFAGAQFIFNGVEGAEDAIARFRELLTLAQEGDLAALGGGEAVPA